MWGRLVTFITVGYICLTRSFAYLGIPPAKLFVGELVLAFFLAAKPRVALGLWVTALLRPSPLNAICLSLYVFVAYGIMQATRGLFEGGGLNVLKYFVFNYYPFYLFLGLWAAVRDPTLLVRTMRIIAWANGLYGMAFLLALQKIMIPMPGAPHITLFGQPNGSALAILGLLCFERNLGRVWYLLVLNIIVLLGISVRAEWLGLGVGVLIWGYLTGKAGQVFMMAFAGIAVVGMVELTDVEIAGRGKIDTGLIISRAIAPINEDLAAEFSPYAATDGGTLRWRQAWWEQIWASAHSDPMLELFGHGYGFELFSLAPANVRAGQEHGDVRTPHNVFYYALGYTGWVGVMLFAVLQFSILKMQWATFRVSGQLIGLLWWVAGLMNAFFSNFFETPFQSIPFYLVMGMSLAPLFHEVRDPASEPTSFRRQRLKMMPRPRMSRLKTPRPRMLSESAKVESLTTEITPKPERTPR